MTTPINLPPNLQIHTKYLYFKYPRFHIFHFLSWMNWNIFSIEPRNIQSGQLRSFITKVPDQFASQCVWTRYFLSQFFEQHVKHFWDLTYTSCLLWSKYHSMIADDTLNSPCHIIISFCVIAFIVISYHNIFRWRLVYYFLPAVRDLSIDVACPFIKVVKEIPI